MEGSDVDELGLELRAVRFERFGRYVVSIATEDDDGELQVFFSQESSPACTPDWGFLGIRINVSNERLPLEVALHFFCDMPSSLDYLEALENGSHFCACKMSITQADVLAAATTEQARSLSLLASRSHDWESAGSVTVALTRATKSHAPLISRRKLPLAKDVARFPLEWQLLQLRDMARRKQDKVHDMAFRLQHMQTALSKIADHRERLQTQRSQLLEENASLERQIKELAEPELTELDVDMLLSFPQGKQKLLLMMLGIEARWSKARDQVIQLWNDFQKVRKQVQGVQQLRHRIDTLGRAREHQQQAFAKANMQRQELTTIWEAVSHRRRMIQNLERQVEGALHSESPSVEAELALSRERGARDMLKEAAAQLDILLHKSQADSALKQKFKAKLRQMSLQADELSLEVERMHRDKANADAAEHAAPTLEDRAHALTQTIVELQLKHNHVCEEANMLEKQSQENALSVARELAQLKIQAAERGARIEQLESILASLSM